MLNTHAFGLEPFTEWLRSDPDTRYEYLDNYGCAYQQYLSEGLGFHNATCGGDYFRLGDGDTKTPMDKDIQDALWSHPRTFGALAKRLADVLEGVA